MFKTKLTLITDAIDSQGQFDSRYTCDLDNSSPELRWDHPPEGTQSFALIAVDLDAPHGDFTHWVVHQIPAEVRHLPAGIPPQETLPNGICQGVNSYGKLGYAGPCPPVGDRPHRYLFRIYALSEFPKLPHRAKKEELLQAITHTTLAQTEILGYYRRMIQKAG